MVVPFNPLKLLLLVGWFYLCLYCVQRTQFSALVPKRHKPVANLVTLFVGPLLLMALAVIDAVRQSRHGSNTTLAILAAHLRTALSTIRLAKTNTPRKEKIRLLDSSGRGIKEIYGRGKTSRHQQHILDLTEQIVFDALEDGASDILIDPADSNVHTVRFRVDGVLRNVRRLDADTAQAVINSIKAAANMDISERRRPQDGAFTARTSDTTAAFRVASAGVVHGEKLSIRVLNQNISTFTLDSIGLSGKQRALIRNAIKKPSGMILLCGPTGSGKTTTLYAMLNEIDFYTRNVITVEDPIECVLPNCSQIEVNPRAGITFASSLRSILRQDPDVICVGEIRDEETAAIALRASQTGHLVLATIHCDTNAAAIVRLMDLGVSELLMASGLSVLTSQRLVRRLCQRCKIKAQPTHAEIAEFRRKGINYAGMYQPKGCRQCNDTGYRGRIGIFDILVLDDKLKALIAKKELSVEALKTEGEKKGKSNLYKQALKLVVTGVTSQDELKRVLG